MSDPKVRFIRYMTVFLFSYSLLTAWLFRSHRIADLPFSLQAGVSALYILSVLIYILFHAVLRLGKERAAWLFALGFFIPLFFEYVGVRTGFPFGEYDYTGLLGPRVFRTVPVVIPIIWSLMFYGVYSVTHLWGENRKGWAGDSWFASIARAVLAGFLMVAWDLVADPLAVSDGYWVWHANGRYFGIPLSNFFGWFLTSFTVFLVFGILTRGLPARKSSFHDFPWLEHLVAIGYFCAVANHAFGCCLKGLRGEAMTGVLVLFVAFVPAARGFRIAVRRRNEAKTVR